MAEIGEVVEVNGKRVKVRLTRTEACAKCGACTAGMSSEHMFVNALNLCSASVGEKVEIEIEGDMFLKAVAIMYGIPLIVMVVGFAAGYYGSIYIKLGNSEFAGFCFGLFCVACAFLWIKKNEPLWKKKNFIPKAVKIQKSL